MKRDERKGGMYGSLFALMCPLWAPSHLSSLILLLLLEIIMPPYMEECEGIFDILQVHSKGMFKR
jgi:hypothetical protein